MFQIGTYVCYPMHGVGWIESIEEREVLGKFTRYYVLRFLSDRMTVMVPVVNAESAGLRRMTDADESERVLSFMLDEAEAPDSNWSKRYRDNMDRLRRGGIYDVASVVRSLSRRGGGQSLSMGERRLYLTARRILLEELAQISGRTEEELAQTMSLPE